MGMSSEGVATTAAASAAILKEEEEKTGAMKGKERVLYSVPALSSRQMVFSCSI